MRVPSLSPTGHPTLPLLCGARLATYRQGGTPSSQTMNTNSVLMVSWVVQDKAGLVFPFWVTASTLVFVTKHLLPLTALHGPTLSVC